MSTQVHPVCETELAPEPLDVRLGPRACISEHLALIEMHTHVAMLGCRLRTWHTVHLQVRERMHCTHPRART